jgi:hypothetical protein
VTWETALLRPSAHRPNASVIVRRESDE